MEYDGIERTVEEKYSKDGKLISYSDSIKVVWDENPEKSDLDKLNEFLLKLANADRVGIRVKIVAIKRFLSEMSKRALEREQNEKSN